MRILFASLTILAIVLAGCSQTPDAPGQTPDSTSDDPGTTTDAPVQDSNETEEAADPGAGDEGPAPAPRGASLSANVTNGTAPLAVNVTLDALDATNVTGWSLDWGDGNTSTGQSVPATAAHVLGAGNHTLTALVTYADGATADASLAIAVANGTAGPIVDTYAASMLFGVGYYGVAPGSPSQAGFVWTSHENGAPWVDDHTVTVPEGAVRLSASTERQEPLASDPSGFTCSEESGGLAPDIDLFLYNADGTFVTSSGNCGTGEALTADVAAGDYVIIVWAFAGAQIEADVTYAIEFA